MRRDERGDFGAFRDHRDQRCKDLGRPGKQLPAEQPFGFSAKIANQSARLGHHQRAGGTVPWSQAEFKESVIATAGDIRQVESGSAGATYPRSEAADPGEELKIALEIIDPAKRETGPEQGFLQSQALGHANPTVIEKCAAAPTGREQFVPIGVVDHPLGDHAALHQRDRDRILRQTVNEIGGAIERIDNPDMLAQSGIPLDRAPLRVDVTGLFAQDRMAGEGAKQRFDDRVFGCPIDFGDKVVGLFTGNADGVDIERRAGNDSACATRGPNPDIDHRMHSVIVEEWLSRIRVVLVGPSHPGNIGAVARAMKTMGLRRLVVVEPREPAFARAPEAIAFASGAHDLLEAAEVVQSLNQALAGTVMQLATASMPREFAALPLDPDTAATQLIAQLRDSAEPVALVFGTERVGLSITQAQMCSHFASIPTAPGCDSLNLAQAVQVFAWSLRRAALQVRTATEPVGVDAAPGHSSAQLPLPQLPSLYATHEQVEGFYGHLESALITIGFLDPAQPKRLMPRLRNLFGRTRLQREEVDILRGICTRMVSQPKSAGQQPDHL